MHATFYKFLYSTEIAKKPKNSLISNPKPLVRLPTFLLFLHLLASPYLVYIILVSPAYQGTSDALHAPSLSLRTIHHSRKLLFSHLMDKLT